MADQVDDTGLNHSLGEGGVDRLGEALETIDDGEQDVLLVRANWFEPPGEVP